MWDEKRRRSLPSDAGFNIPHPQPFDPGLLKDGGNQLLVLILRRSYVEFEGLIQITSL